MPEILTESFCERCGTRYTFESAAPRTHRLKGVKVLSRGLRNFVMSDDTSLDEAMAAARSDTDREVTSQQLDAFHKAFNFCMQCRQYTCANCWNDAEGRCLTCAPHLGQDILEAPFPDLAASPQLDLREATDGNGTNGHHDPALDALAWPTSDLLRDATLDEPGFDGPAADELAVGEADDEIEAIDAVARLAALGAVARDEDRDEVAADADAGIGDVTAIAEGELAGATGDELAGAAKDELAGAADVAATGEDEQAGAAEETAAALVPGAVGDAEVAAAAPADRATTEPLTDDAGPTAGGEPDGDIDRRAAAAAAATAQLLRSFRPGQSLDDALEAYEREHDAGSVAAAAAASAALAAQGEPATDVGTPTPLPAEAGTTTEEPVDAAATEADEDHHLAAAAAAAAAAASMSSEPEGIRSVDHVEQPTWRIVAPDPGAAEPVAPAGDAPTSAPPIAATSEPQWPAQPQWPTPGQSAGLPFLGRPAAATGGMDALWAESARAVASVPGTPAAGATAKAAGGVQPCVSCGLSLSATARFCRRCGSRQG
jgi:hypothetical protein